MALNGFSISRDGKISGHHLRIPVRPLAFGVYFGAVLGLCLAGLFLSIYLAVSHYRVHTDMGFQSFCALSKSINCDTVSQSPYSVLGPLPVAVWGVAGYGFFLLLLVFTVFPSAGRRRVWALCLATAIIFSIGSTAFAAISSLLIGSYCILCIVTYAINFLLVYFTWIIRRRFRDDLPGSGLVNDLRFLWQKRRFSIPVFTAFAGGMLAALLAFPAYWQVALPAASASIPTGITAEGLPWIGAENPVLDIVEFTDYQCFQCRKMHYYLRELVARHPDKIRLTHCNYPMDHEFNPIVTEPFHVGSGQMALLAIHAAASSRFVELNDLLFAKAAAGQAIDLAEVTRETGIDLRELQQALTHEPYKSHLLRDIRQGMKLRIAGTPSYWINGSVYEGRIPPELLNSILE
jgi:uncharacterized membrane protein/predicted DsbA family dithiol-disulfide isomerase